MTQPVDPARLAAELIRCPSITPEEGGALTLLSEVLGRAGFDCVRVDRAGTPNLFARWGEKGAGRTFGFNGHTDVVPLGDPGAWTVEPFGGAIRDGILYGRGATDMKSGVAAFAAAAVDFVTETPPEDGAVILTITGDEEGPGMHGTTAILDWMATNGEAMDACIVGEPTCPETMGEMIKIGRRGSLSCWITIDGVQGHSAYPHRARNPVAAMARLMDRLASHRIDEGSEHFDPSTLAVVGIDTGNSATNVIPGSCRGTVNVRFNDLHSSEAIVEWIGEEAGRVTEEFDVDVKIDVKVSGESFLTPPGPLVDLVSAAVAAETGLAPVLSTTGGTSDARFVKDHCPVVEFGLVGKTMHKVDECVPVDQIHTLKAVYGRVLRDFFT